MTPYIVSLIKLSSEKQVQILDAFKLSGVPTSTYYRAVKGAELKHQTAIKIEDAIYTLQKTSTRNGQLAKDNQ
tara:strand:- start:544 stop:762 length:219 start_codon:yes stop_codon:yes gene_type:complete